MTESRGPVVRPIRAEDVAAAATALVDVHGTDGYPVEGVAQPEAWIAPPGVVAAWVGVLDGQVVGHVAVMSPNGDEDAVALWRSRGADGADIGVLARLFVVRAARGQGLGESLVREAMAFARARSLRLVLDVLHKDTAAIRLYDRLGWHPIGEAQHHYGTNPPAPARCYTWPAPYGGTST
jgi:ribosomal protein S18 acetylase RimI-like enzyme